MASLRNRAMSNTRSDLRCVAGWNRSQGTRLNWGSLAPPLILFSRRSHSRRDSRMIAVCEVADDPVVVKKFWPMKAGNRVEDKTGMTAVGHTVGSLSSKVTG